MEDHSKTWYSSRVFVVALIAVVLLAAIIYAISSRGSDKSAVATTPTGQVAAPVVAPAPPPILTKDPEFIKLIHPAQSDDDLLAQSAEFAQKKQEIEAQLAAIHDSDLRTQASEEAWSKVDKAAYIEREKKTIADSFPAAIQQILSRHHADWFEVGHVSFPGTSSFAVTSVEASPVTVLDDATVPINVAMLDGVYSKFDSITGPQIEQNVASQVQAKSCDQQLKNVCQNLGGSSSQCSDPAELENVRSQLQFSCDAGPSADELRQKAKQETRASRLVLVGQGDLPSHRIDKLMLVDYDTEAILLELPADSLASKIFWKPLLQSHWTNEAAEGVPTESNISAPTSISEVNAPDVANGTTQTVSDALSAWATAEESNDPARQAECYSDQIDRYFLSRNVSKDYVRDYMTTWLKEHSRRVVTFSPKDIAVEDESTEQVKVRLVKDVVTKDDQGSSERLTRSILYLRKENGQWKIFSEQDLK